MYKVGRRWIKAVTPPPQEAQPLDEPGMSPIVHGFAEKSPVATRSMGRPLAPYMPDIKSPQIRSSLKRKPEGALAERNAINRWLKEKTPPEDVRKKRLQSAIKSREKKMRNQVTPAAIQDATHTSDEAEQGRDEAEQLRIHNMRESASQIF